jgi:hypothetical protein
MLFHRCRKLWYYFVWTGWDWRRGYMYGGKLLKLESKGELA